MAIVTADVGCGLMVLGYRGVGGSEGGRTAGVGHTFVKTMVEG